MWPALPLHRLLGLIRVSNPLIVVFAQSSIDLNSRPDLSGNTRVAAEGTVPACSCLFSSSQCPRQPWESEPKLKGFQLVKPAFCGAVPES